MKGNIRVTVWNEYRHERKSPEIAALYPQGIHGTIAAFLNAQPGIEASTATLDEPEHGLTDEVLENTDVLIWWGHMAHREVQDEIVDKVQKRILNGMGLIVLHSAHFSKIFRRMMGTSCSLKWREIGEKNRLWVTSPGHPIVEGLGPYFEVPHTEMYGEFFDIPQPDELIFISWFQGGEVFRSGCAYYRGRGKVFYFQPGHETFPIYDQEEVRLVLTNAVRWAAPVTVHGFREMPQAPHVREPMEKFEIAD
jgi:trehalose utilization protein